MASKENYLTAEGNENLLKELDYLKTIRRKEVADRIRKASEDGGTVDNAEYDEAKNEQAFVEGRISDLEKILSNAVVAPASDGPKGLVELGSLITVVADGGVKQHYKIVGSAEAAPLEGKISIESPVGRALLGHKKGDTVDVQTPARVLKLTIIKVS